jgi:glycosyltransferase involved in cell wall biosynthesis
MEIIYATYQYFPDYRTNTFQSMSTINELIKNDIKVKLIFPERKIPTTKKDIYEFYNLNPKLKITKIKHTKYFKYLNDSFFNRIIYLANHFIFACRVKNYTSSSHQEETVLYTRSAIVLFMMRNSNRKLVYEIHQLTRLSIFLTSLSYKRNKKILFVTITPTLKNMILDIGIDKLNVMYLETGYNEEVFSGIEKIEKRNDNKVKFIFGGSLSIAGQSKGLEEIILSLDNLIKLGDVKNCTFSIYCSNQYEKEELLDFINKNNIQKDIKIYDRINSNEFLRELLNSDIGFIPLPDSNHVNKFSSSMKYFEYIRADLVIVCSNVEANKRFNYPKSIFYNNESKEIALAIKSSIELLSSGVTFDKKNIQEYSIQNRVYKIVKKINEI